MNDLARPVALTFREALLFWLKLGFISFARPCRERIGTLVLKNRWLRSARIAAEN